MWLNITLVSTDLLRIVFVPVGLFATNTKSRRRQFDLRGVLLHVEFLSTYVRGVFMPRRFTGGRSTSDGLAVGAAQRGVHGRVGHGLCDGSRGESWSFCHQHQEFDLRGVVCCCTLNFFQPHRYRLVLFGRCCF